MSSTPNMPSFSSKTPNDISLVDISSARLWRWTRVRQLITVVSSHFPGLGFVALLSRSSLRDCVHFSKNNMAIRNLPALVLLSVLAASGTGNARMLQTARCASRTAQTLNTWEATPDFCVRVRPACTPIFLWPRFMYTLSLEIQKLHWHSPATGLSRSWVASLLRLRIFTKRCNACPAVSFVDLVMG